MSHSTVSILPTGARCAKVLDLAHARVEQRSQRSNAGPMGRLQRDETCATHGDPRACQGTPCVWQSLSLQVRRCSACNSASVALTVGRAAEQCWCPDKESRRGASAAVLAFLSRRAKRRVRLRHTASRASHTNDEHARHTRRGLNRPTAHDEGRKGRGMWEPISWQRAHHVHAELSHALISRPARPRAD